MSLQLICPEFSDTGIIPKGFTCEGDDVSPPLSWSGEPPETKSFVLVCADPDAPQGTFYHWAAYDIPADWHGLEPGYGEIRQGTGFREAVNDFGWAGYDGPCPPVGHGPHRYFFRLSALRVEHLKVPADAGCADVEKAAEAVTLESSEWMGTYER